MVALGGELHQPDRGSAVQIDGSPPPPGVVPSSMSTL